MSKALEDDGDPTYTHFAHRPDFLKLLSPFVAVDLSRDPSEREDEEEEKLVKALGAIVRQA